MISRVWKFIGVLLLLLVLCVLAFARYGYSLGDSYASAALTVSEQNSKTQKPTKPLLAETLERGAYLVRVGDCMACHTTRGGAAYAGGRVMQSEFGQFVTPNITFDKKTGIGEWSAEDFWNALHNGKAKDGRLLYPSFPFVNYTHVSREDADAMYAYLQSQPTVVQENADHDLAFPYNQRPALALWRAVYFKPGALVYQSKQSTEWNRGAYLVRGLAHCSACHSTRNSIGANQGSADFSGGEMAQIRWYAPSLQSTNELNLPNWSDQEITQLLVRGNNLKSVVAGPMAEVVQQSLQYLSDPDARAIATYLRALPQHTQSAPDLIDRAIARPTVSQEQMLQIMERGEKIYKTQCMDCHGKGGEGVSGIYPALKGNVSLQTTSLTNPIRLILAGGFAPATRLNPRPYSMPPFAPILDDTEVATVLTYIRNAWGNKGDVVSPSEVNPYRTAPLD
jgi:mono/diheme cytochrome c family protein